MRLAIAASHPIQYYAPLFRELARRIDLKVFYAHRATGEDQANAGFDVGFEWDCDLYSGYAYEFLSNTARHPSLDRFGGCDTPEIYDRLKQGRYDALLVLGWLRKSFIQAIVAAKRLGIPVLVRGDSQLNTPRSAAKRMAKRVVYPIFLRQFDAALYVGQRSLDYWAYFGYPSSRLFFSPHCVDTQWFASNATDTARARIRAKLDISPDAKVALFAGKLVAFKRPLDVIAAAGLMKGQGFSLEVLVAGAGPLEPELTAAARKASVPLHLLGFCNQSEMPGAYAASDVLVLPSERETWGLVANEALACGRTIVISDAAGCAPDLARPEVGVTFPVRNITAMATAIANVLTFPRNSFAIANVSASHSLQVASDGIIAAIHSTTQQRLIPSHGVLNDRLITGSEGIDVHDQNNPLA